MIRNKLLYILTLAAVVIQSCRSDEQVVNVEDSIITDSPSSVTDAGNARGMYLLCEGNMGSNKATIDYLDLSNPDGKVHYQRNIFASRNPTAVKELGDVGNDIQIYGSRLWIAVNCSNKVEVCTSDSCHRIGQVNIPNCRYVAFAGRYAYISSYAGPVTMGSAQQGRVYKVDTLTLEKVDSVTVGRQPEEMAVIGGKLYVANSGGYTPDNYDRTLSVIDLNTFVEERRIDVDVNLHRVRKDRYNQLWVTSRGDNGGRASCLYYLTVGADGIMHVEGKIDTPVSEMCIVGDTLYYIGTQYNNGVQSGNTGMGLIDIRRHEPISTTMFRAPEIAAMELPYGIAVNPDTKSFFLMDAKNYVSSGELLHFHPDGTLAWRQWTGDIPSRAVFVSKGYADNTPVEPPHTGNSPWIEAVDEYMPAPGQFVNMLPKYDSGDDASAMIRKCTEYIAGEAGRLVTLGGFGGYITFHFDHPVMNVPGEYDLQIFGNAHSDGSEPGIVMVSQDTNGNGLPDDSWYELSGSADIDSVGKVMYGYEITYRYVPMSNVPWTDNMGNSGAIERNTFHSQEYFPLWRTGTDGGMMTFKGTRLPDNAHKKSGNGSLWTLVPMRYGYVDNLSNADADGCSFNIDWAVDPVTRQHVRLDKIDFVRVYSAMNQQCGWIGETSTEIQGARDLHK